MQEVSEGEHRQRAEGFCVIRAHAMQAPRQYTHELLRRGAWQQRSTQMGRWAQLQPTCRGVCDGRGHELQDAAPNPSQREEDKNPTLNKDGSHGLFKRQLTRAPGPDHLVCKVGVDSCGGKGGGGVLACGCVYLYVCVCGWVGGWVRGG
jgi:hypothetical protein